MYARDGKVVIHKGFMDEDDFIRAINNEHFGKRDAVVYHCRISTQAGVCPEMTHPFPYSKRLEDMKRLDISKCDLGIAHNGIIRLTSSNDKEYSDTALFINEYLLKLIRKPSDLKDTAILRMILELTNSKWAMLDGSGYIATVGNWIEDDGVLYSNHSYMPIQKQLRWFTKE